MSSKTPNILTLTANCGLSGIQACEFEAMFADSSSPEIILISAQECDLAKTLQAFAKANKQLADDDKYTAENSGLMITYTKPAVWMGNTGMVTIALSRHGYAVEFDNNKREENRRGHAFVSAYNKGSLFSVMTIKKRDVTVGRIYHSNYHLDSNKQKARARDLYTLHKNRYKSFNTFSALVDATPDLVILAGDTNIRDRYDEQNDKVDIKVWPQGHAQVNTLAEVDPLVLDFLLTEGAQGFSAKNTYFKANKKTGIHKRECHKKGKRQGHVNQGQLDRVSVRDNNKGMTNSKISQKDAPFSIERDYQNARDHLILGSHVNLAQTCSDFDKVKNSLCQRLQSIAPKLATEISESKRDATNQLKLLDLHNFLFGTPSDREGLIIQLIDPDLPEEALEAKHEIIRDIAALNFKNIFPGMRQIEKKLEKFNEFKRIHQRSIVFDKFAKGLLAGALVGVSLITLSALSFLSFGLLPLGVGITFCAAGSIACAHKKHSNSKKAKGKLDELINFRQSYTVMTPLCENKSATASVEKSGSNFRNHEAKNSETQRSTSSEISHDKTVTSAADLLTKPPPSTDISPPLFVSSLSR